MIRLAVPSTEEASWGRIASRLRGATIEVCPGEPPTDCEAVVFAEPPVLEKAAIERCLRAGKHVLLASEPWVLRFVLDELLATAQKAGVQFAAVNPDRYLPSRQFIKQQLTEKIGAAGLVRLHRWEPMTDGSFEDRGAMLFAPLARDVDLTLWLIGELPDRVYAVERLYGSDLYGRRYLQVHLGFPGGSMALLDFSARLPVGDRYHSLSVIGASGAVYADDHQNMQLVYRGGHPQAVRTEEGPMQTAAMVQDFVNALREGRDLGATVTAWRDVNFVLHWIRRSLTSGQAMVLGGA